MTTGDVISTDLAVAMRRLKLSPLQAVLPERLSLARQQKMPYQDFLLQLLQDEVMRRDGLATTRRAQKANLDPAMVFEAWDASAKVTFNQELLNELVSLRFLEGRRHASIFGPVGVGKTFVANALGHVACRRGYSVNFTRHDKLLKSLKHARLDNTYDAELCRLLAVDLLIVDDFALDAMDSTESRDTYEILVERHRAGSMVLTSNRAPDEWLSTFADPARAQSAIDRFTNNSYDLVIDGETYRARQKPRVGSQEGAEAENAAAQRSRAKPRRATRRRRGK